MKIAIRVDASSLIGSGHVIRCKTLADRLRRRRAEVRFICRGHPGNLIPLLRSAGYPVTVLPASQVATTQSVQNYATWLGVEQSVDAVQTIESLGDFRPDWLVVDHYALDATWESRLRPYVGCIMAIDDLANRSHNCDLLLDQNLSTKIEDRYANLLPPHAKLLLGPQFALLRPEFCGGHEMLRERDGTVRRILVFFGGVDKTLQTEMTLDAIRQIGRPEISVDVVVGVNNLRAETINVRCHKVGNVNFYQQIANMAELMMHADLALGAGGGASWERCSVGLPAIVVITSDNQLATVEELERAGAVLNLGRHENVTATTWAEAIRRVLERPEALRQMSQNAIKIIGRHNVDCSIALLDAIGIGAQGSRAVACEDK